MRSIQLVPAFVLLVLAACSTSGGTAASRGGNAAANPRWSGEAALPPPEAAAPSPRGDRRIIYFQAREGVTLILVNEGHSGRSSNKGRLSIAMNDPRGSYKVFADAEMDALLKSMEDRGLARLQVAFEPGDEDYLSPDRAAPDRYRGILYLEEAGRRTKVLGFRPNGKDDVLGQDRYRVFTELKALVTLWYREKNIAESPVGGTGAP